MRHVSDCRVTLRSASTKKAKNQMSSENLTDQFASAVMTGSINEGDIARAGANGACDATRRESRNPVGNQSINSAAILFD